jgi:hypothetical protein
MSSKFHDLIPKDLITDTMELGKRYATSDINYRKATQKEIGEILLGQSVIMVALNKIYDAQSR